MFCRLLVAAALTAAAALTVAPSAPAANTPPHCNDSDLHSDGEQIGVGSACSDPDRNAPFTFRIVSQPAHGVAQAYNAPSPAGVGYRPEPGFVGTDSFTYVASDGQADSNVATVRITVGPQPPPSCSATGETAAPAGLNYVVRLSCSPGGDGLPIAFAIDSPPAHATYELQRFNDFTADVTIHAAGDYGGPDAFTWHAAGPRGLTTGPSTWSFTVLGPPATAPSPPGATPATPAPTPPTAPTGGPVPTDPFAVVGAQVSAPHAKTLTLRSGATSGGLFVVRCSAACDARLTGGFTAHGRRVALATQRLHLAAGGHRALRLRTPAKVRSRLGARPSLRLRLVVVSGGRSAARTLAFATRIR